MSQHEAAAERADLAASLQAALASGMAHEEHQA